MASEAEDQSIWPIVKFQFSVDIGDQKDLVFQEVTGLEAETEVIEYRAGDSKQFSTVKMPGITKGGSVTLKRGIFLKDKKFVDWYSQISMNTLKRGLVVIKLLDETENPTMVWTLQNAWPTKVSGTDLKADGNEIAVEALEIVHEGITVVNA